MSLTILPSIISKDLQFWVISLYSTLYMTWSILVICWLAILEFSVRSKCSPRGDIKCIIFVHSRCMAYVLNISRQNAPTLRVKCQYHIFFDDLHEIRLDICNEFVGLRRQMSMLLNATFDSRLGPLIHAKFIRNMYEWCVSQPESVFHPIWL